ncbi:hypothetical protein NDI52_30075 [Leptolyngbya sp. PL-A3]|uniref:hypothetical protein n=1 Tax=Leptolyngbya sp. PL-A3 TaxID=2933911 RepID=UPI0032987F25
MSAIAARLAQIDQLIDQLHPLVTQIPSLEFEEPRSNDDRIESTVSFYRTVNKLAEIQSALEDLEHTEIEGIPRELHDTLVTRTEKD